MFSWTTIKTLILLVYNFIKPFYDSRETELGERVMWFKRGIENHTFEAHILTITTYSFFTKFLFIYRIDNHVTKRVQYRISFLEELNLKDKLNYEDGLFMVNEFVLFGDTKYTKYFDTIKGSYDRFYYRALTMDSIANSVMMVDSGIPHLLHIIDKTSLTAMSRKPVCIAGIPNVIAEFYKSGTDFDKVLDYLADLEISVLKLYSDGKLIRE